MAHFAELNEQNIVQQVIVISNDDCGGGEFPESETVGQAFIGSLGLTGLWIQCSYHGNFRAAFPGMGWTYDSDNDVFVAPPTPPVEEA